MKTQYIINCLIQAPHSEIYLWPDSPEIVINQISLRKRDIKYEAFYRYFDVIKKIIELDYCKKILDWGGGLGTVSTVLYDLGYEVEVCDIEPEYFQGNKNITIKYADLNSSFPYKDSSIDCICGVEVIEHLENTSFFVRECSRVLKEHGYLLVTTPNPINIKSIRNQIQRGYLSHFNAENCHEHITPIFPWIFVHIAQKYGLSLRKVQTNVLIPVSLREWSIVFLRNFIFRGVRLNDEILNYGSHLLYILIKNGH